MKKKIAFALLMGSITTGIISFTLISFNLGFNAKFMKIWLFSWMMAYSIAVPAILVISPRVQRFLDKFF